MPELRQNFFTKEWVIIATERAQRPEDLATHPVVQPVSAFVESCPFCQGNESKTPPEVLGYPVSGEPWAVRVIPNKFAACRATCSRRVACSTCGGALKALAFTK